MYVNYWSQELPIIDISPKKKKNNNILVEHLHEKLVKLEMD